MSSSASQQAGNGPARRTTPWASISAGPTSAQLAPIRLTRNPQLKTLSEYINRLTVPSREKTTERVIENGEIRSYMRLHRELYEVIERQDRSSIEKAVLNHYVFWEKNNG